MVDGRHSDAPAANGAAPRRAARTALAIFAAGAMVAGPGPVTAQETAGASFGPPIDWSVLLRVRTTMEADTNRRLDEDADFVAGGTGRATLNVSARTKRSSFSSSTTVDGQYFTGSDDIDNINEINPNLNANLTIGGKLISFFTSGSFRTRPTSDSEIDDSGVTDINSTRIDANASAGINWSISPRATATFSGSFQIVDFTELADSFTPSQTYGIRAGLGYAASKTTTYSFSAGFREFDTDRNDARTSRTFQTSVGLSHRRTERHSLGLRAGFSTVDTQFDSGRSSNELGFVGGASFGYSIDQLSLGLNLEQTIQPSSDGDLNSFTRLGGDLGYRINQLSSLGFGISFVRRQNVGGGGDVLQTITLSPSYNYQLGKDTSLSLAYRFQVRDETDEDVRSRHAVTLALTHDLTLLQ